MRAWLNLVGWLLLAALLALAGVWLGKEPGQVQVRWLGYQIDTSMAFVLVALAALLLVLWLLDGVLRRFPRAWRRRRAEHLRGTLRRGLICLAEARWVAAKRLLLKASTLPEQRPLALYGAALAAQNGVDNAMADELLGTLSKSPWSSPARAAYARQQLRLGHPQAAEVSLSDLQVPAERLAWIEALFAQGRAAEVLQRWPEILALKLPDKPALQQLQQRLLHAAMNAADSSQQIDAIWETLDRAARETPSNVQHYAEAALRLHSGEQVVEPLQRAFKLHPEQPLAELFALYGLLPHADLRAALKKVEAWRDQYPATAELELALARLCRRLELWGKAHDVLVSALGQWNTTALWEELGLLAAAQGDHRLAAQALGNALARGRGQHTQSIDLQLRGHPDPLATTPSSSTAGAPANEERGVYGFPLPPGG